MKKRLILFVHGLGGDSETSWGQFPQLIRNDEELHKNYDIDFYSYPTSIFPISLFKKGPKIQEIANGLRTMINNRFDNYLSIGIVCHSLGGLIARKYLLDEIKRGNKTRINKLLLYAVPNNGANLAAIGKYLAFRNRQIAQICKDSDLIELLNEDWFQLEIANFVEVKYVIGSLDQIVDERSAKNYWGNLNIETIIDKGHIDIVKPCSYNDLAFLVLKKFLGDFEPPAISGKLIEIPDERKKVTSNENRRAVYQQAYALAVKMKSAIHAEDIKQVEVIAQAQNWYDRSNMSLERELRDEFRKSIHYLGGYENLMVCWKETGHLKGWNDPETKQYVQEIRESFKTIAELPQKIENSFDRDERLLKLLVHKARFVNNETEYFFINATNLSPMREVEVTHIWFEGDGQIAVLQDDRPLPKRLKLDETWETRIECHKIPDWAQDDAYTMFRARLSSGEIFDSQKNDNVPQMGFPPGGQADQTEADYDLAIKTYKLRINFSTFGTDKIRSEFQCTFHNKGKKPIALVASNLALKFDEPLSNGTCELKLDLYSYKDQRKNQYDKTIRHNHLILDPNTIENVSLKFYLNIDLKEHEKQALRDELNGIRDFVFFIQAIDIENNVYSSMPTRVSEF